MQKRTSASRAAAYYPTARPGRLQSIVDLIGETTRPAPAPPLPIREHSLFDKFSHVVTTPTTATSQPDGAEISVLAKGSIAIVPARLMQRLVGAQIDPRRVRFAITFAAR